MLGANKATVFSFTPAEAAYCAGERGDIREVERLMLANPGIDFSYVLVSARRTDQFTDDKSLMKFLCGIQSFRFMAAVVKMFEATGHILRMTDMGVSFVDFHTRLSDVYSRMNINKDFNKAYDEMMQKYGDPTQEHRNKP